MKDHLNEGLYCLFSTYRANSSGMGSRDSTVPSRMSDFRRFLSSSPFPGVNRLSEASSPALARSAWAAFLLSCVAACTIIVQENFVGWEEDPAEYQTEGINFPVRNE